jgi:hypothetical protein
VPSKTSKTRDPILVALHGSDQYARFLDRLLKLVQRTRPAIRTRTQLADLALAELGFREGLRAPRRCRPLGANQYGEPEPEPGP